MHISNSVIEEMVEAVSVLTNYLEKEITGIEKDKFTLAKSNAVFEITKDPIKLAEWHQKKSESLEERGNHKNGERSK